MSDQAHEHEVMPTDEQAPAMTDAGFWPRVKNLIAEDDPLGCGISDFLRQRVRAQLDSHRRPD